MTSTCSSASQLAKTATDRALTGALAGDRVVRRR